MKRKPLGRTGLEVSALCLGSMTWGSQNDAEEAHDQLDRAMAVGVNFVDTAEMYPVNPIRDETIGRTERILGLWLEDRERREDVIIATKHTGEGQQFVREGAPIGPDTIEEAITGSLRRLKTDYIDLYQFHWPNRGSYMFRKNWNFDPSGIDPIAEIRNFEDCMEILQDEVERGRIRAFGLSNESAWGMMQWLAAAEKMDGPRPASVQNEYSMMCRMFDTDMAELCLHEDVGLLAFSPLATGLLTGKYQNKAKPKGSRITLNPDLGGRTTSRAFEAVETYLKIAKKHGLDPAQMALAWAMSRPFMTSVIFGATTMDQLEVALGSASLTLPDEVLADIDAAHRLHPMPF